MEEQIQLFKNSEVSVGRRETNPLIKAFGKGPEGTKCNKCEHFGYKQYAKKYYKCDLRGTTGASTDHNYHFNSCGKFKELVPSEQIQK